MWPGPCLIPRFRIHQGRLSSEIKDKTVIKLGVLNHESTKQSVATARIVFSGL